MNTTIIKYTDNKTKWDISVFNRYPTLEIVFLFYEKEIFTYKVFKNIIEISKKQILETWSENFNPKQTYWLIRKKYPNGKIISLTPSFYVDFNKKASEEIAATLLTSILYDIHESYQIDSPILSIIVTIKASIYKKQ